MPGRARWLYYPDTKNIAYSYIHYSTFHNSTTLIQPFIFLWLIGQLHLHPTVFFVCTYTVWLSNFNSLSLRCIRREETPSSKNTQKEDQGHRIGNNPKAKHKTKWTATYIQELYLTVLSNELKHLEHNFYLIYYWELKNVVNLESSSLR